MLDDYKDKQLVAYNILNNAIISNRVSHAYLIDENNNDLAFDMIMAFVKKIICNDLDPSLSHKISKRIDDDNYPEVKVIKPDGLLIKKQQILDLQKEFSMAAVEGSKRIYIIRDADKMRTETANSMLKFLEEPDSQIVAILMTNNFENLLPTIVSRCQVIRLTNDIVHNIDLDLSKFALEFIEKIEFSGIRSIIDTHELLFNKISVKERDKFILFFDKMIDIYYDILKIFSGCSVIKFADYYEQMLAISNLNTYDKILLKINILLELKDTIKNNVNLSLLCDSMVVRIGGINDDRWY